MAERRSSAPSDPAPRFADLGPRIASAAVMAGLGLGLVWAGGAWTALLAAAVTGAMIWEWRAITLHAGGRPGADTVFLLAGVVGAPLIAGLATPLQGAVWLAWSLLFAAAADLVTGRRAVLGWGVLGGVYLGAAGIAFVYLRGLEPFGLITVIWLVLTVAAADIGGYFGGRLIGGPKLWPRLSPKKTWAGALGGLAGAALVGLGVALVAGTGPGRLVLVSAGVALVAMAGDLAESALKRRFGVKDSGRLLPGHGGALDRFDGLAPAAVAVALACGATGGSVAAG